MGTLRGEVPEMARTTQRDVMRAKLGAPPVDRLFVNGDAAR